MIGCALEEHRIKFLYFSVSRHAFEADNKHPDIFQGDMTTKQRQKAVEKFRDDKTINVMIAGLKCGGLGLNLAFANRVIIA